MCVIKIQIKLQSRMKPTKISPLTHIMVKGANENNLKNLDVNIPKNQLVVLTGLSGSGKSSLAFNTIYAEGNRRYLDSLSSYARQFLGNSDKPNVDSIEGLSPAISIDQKSTSHNPRSTVGTVTEIYDYLRLLFAKIGVPHCPNGHGPIQSMSVRQIVNTLIELPVGTKLQILAPIAIGAKGTFKHELEKYRKAGYLRVLVDGIATNLDEPIKLNKNSRHDIAIIIDRIVLENDPEVHARIYAAVELAGQEANGLVHIHYKISDAAPLQTWIFSQNHACWQCQFTLPPLEPRLFSFNSPAGACGYCNGLGFSYEPDPTKIFANQHLSILAGGIEYFKNTVDTTNLDWQKFNSLLLYYHIPIDVPIQDLSQEQITILFQGSHEPIPIDIVSASGKKYQALDRVEGVGALLKRRHLETQSQGARDYYHKFMSEIVCAHCQGQKLSPNGLAVLLGNYNIIQLTELNISDTIRFLQNLPLNPKQQQVAKLALKEIVNRLQFLENVGLNYLTLSRNANSLSGGEAQRIRLASQLGSSLTGVLYVLDEPSIGLHQRDNSRLINTLKQMRDLGNSILVVEHDEETIRAADWIIEIGPKAGVDGGQLVVAGPITNIINCPDSITGQYLSYKKLIPTRLTYRGGNHKTLRLRGATGNNLKNVNVDFPLQKLIAVTGVSGSGKSTLINEILIPALKQKLHHTYSMKMQYQSLSGFEHIDRVIEISQDPIGRTPRSNPATYVGVFDDIRDLYALLPQSKELGYTKGRFSFNVKGGRCEKCQGDGEIKIEMHFLPDIYIVCDECNGQKYDAQTLAIKYKNKSIYDVLNMTVDQALEFFDSIPGIYHKLQLMCEVGIGYLKLGTNSNHLSGGEAQRIKLAKHLQKKAKGHGLYVLDEPTTGLHVHDIAQLLQTLNKIVNQNNTVIIIEHNLELIKTADHIIDLGPEGGIGGGRVVLTGTPSYFAQNPQKSHTAYYLRPYFDVTNNT